ncbi:phosphoadenosine phosphosulfate reductase family protein [Aldersonia sp. NBC_00410]|uniref:phosphoadenosine phosphosulfate reductase family protein n=1 Tax=Aldersonia sp. NBC_00410 TaxID=2975954 RepID=UPI002257A22B|nr:phosphoadenosine phosphosulfate reductase family protein [Aldersonia sp. NBC_00410]MCX5046235.1 phosphoadenosine phosphosulfate reductase family protein [Aldersonia sp. NBC_00410]
MQRLPDPGLDLTVLRRVRSGANRTGPRELGRMRDRIADHLDRHDGYVAFSGGKDSLVVLHLARSVEPDVPVAFFDSGLEYPETYDYIRELATNWHLDLHVIPSVPTLLQVLVDSGLWDHTRTGRPVPDLQRVLITDPAKRAHEQLGPGELWGVRADESAARRALYTRHGRCDGVIARLDGTIAYGPIWNWSTSEVWGYAAYHHLSVNPVYAKLAALGVREEHSRLSHLIDGNHLERGRLTWLQRGWPTLFEQLADALPRIRQMT